MKLGVALIPKDILKDHWFRTRSEEKNSRVKAFVSLFGPPPTGGSAPSSTNIPFLKSKRLTGKERMAILKQNEIVSGTQFLGNIKAEIMFHCRFWCEGYWFKFVTLRSSQGEKRYQLRWGG